MSTFDLIARRIIIEAGLEEFNLTPEWILQAWLKSRYREVIDELAFVNLNKTADEAFTTVPVVNGTSGTATEGSEIFTGTGFTSDFVGRFLRLGGDNEWYKIVYVLSATQLRLDTVYANNTKTTGYQIAKRYYTIPFQIRWLFDIKIPRRAFTLFETHPAKLDEMFPNRNWAPSVPQWWSPFGWDEAQGQRIVEIYPPSDQIYRLEATGYSGVEEPVLDSSPHRDISDRLLTEGALADAFRFRASHVPQSEIIGVRALLNVAQSHENRWLELLERQRRRDTLDAPKPRVRLLVQRRDTYGRGLYDPLMTAEDEVWNRSPAIGDV